MKIICSLLLLFSLVSHIFAQSAATDEISPNVAVVQNKWHSEVRIPALNDDPLRAHKELEKANREREEAENQQRMTKQRQRPEPTPIPTRPPQRRNTDTWVLYTYEAKVRNDGQKDIQSLIWDYVFYEKGTEKEVGRLRFKSKAGIAPGKIKNLVIHSLSPPTDSIDAKIVAKQAREEYTERIVIQQIQYEDGSVWQTSVN